MLFSNLLEENNASETSAASPDGSVKDKSKTADEATFKKFKKDNKTVKGHLLNHTTSPSICLLPLNLPRSFVRNWRSSMELTTLKRRNMWLVNGCVFIILMTSQAWNKLIFIRTCVQKF